jgi:tRNA-dihydrouridine synthase B
MTSPAFVLGTTPIYSPVLLAPMAGITDIVFRGLVRQWSPDSLICTEMISSNGMIYSKQRKARILDHTPQDHPISYQLAANKPEILIEAARQIIEDHDPVAIDLNMGCPVKKITGNFEGCALMREPEHAAMLVKQLVDAIDKPVSIKFRLGWDADSMNYLDFGKRLEDAGASMVALHARTRAQGYAPGCKWDAYGELKQALRIPVIANGDINTPEDAKYVMDTYGVDGVMVGRATQGKPWYCGDLSRYLLTGETSPELSLRERLAVAAEHAQLLSDYRGEHTAMKEMRKHFAWYIEGFRNARIYRIELMKVSTLEDMNRVFDTILREQEQLALVS